MMRPHKPFQEISRPPCVPAGTADDARIPKQRGCSPRSVSLAPVYGASRERERDGEPCSDSVCSGGAQQIPGKGGGLVNGVGV